MSHLLQSDSYSKIQHTVEEHLMWEKLYSKQIKNLEDKAFPTFLENIYKFNLSPSRIPNLLEVSEKLENATGWQVVPVSGLIGYESYFTLLSQKKFPSTTFIRSTNEENLSKDPDIFHEVFGHCTMLLSQDYADFMQQFATFALTVKSQDRPLFARLIWFTTETGLINTAAGVKIYGSSVMSSFTESTYSLTGAARVIKKFNVIDIFREPYRADILQNTYYVLDNTQQLYSLLNRIEDLYKYLSKARNLGEFTPLFPVEHSKYSNIGHCYPLEIEMAIN